MQTYFNEKENTKNIPIEKDDSYKGICTQSKEQIDIDFLTLKMTCTEIWTFDGKTMKWEYSKSGCASDIVSISDAGLQNIIYEASGLVEQNSGQSNLTLTCVYGNSDNYLVDYEICILTPYSQAYCVYKHPSGDSVCQLNHNTSSSTSPDNPQLTNVYFSSAGEVNAEINKLHQSGPYLNVYELEAPDYDLLKINQENS